MSSGKMEWKGFGAIALTASLFFAACLPAVAYAQEEPVATIQASDQRVSVTALGSSASERDLDAVAIVDNVEYTTLDDALANVRDGQTVKVLANTKMTTGRVSGISITLDLNGCTVEVDNRAFNVVSGGRLTLEDTSSGGLLKVNKIGNVLSLGIVTGTKGSVVMKGGTLEVPEYGIYTTNDDTGAYAALQGGVIKATYGICAIGNGTPHSARVEVSGGEIQAGVFGFGTNGSTGNGGVDFFMSGGDIKSLAEDAPALYLPAYYSTATVTGGTITGGTGIEIRAGELSVSGDARISGTGPLISSPNGSGSTSSGAGIAVAQHATKQPIKVIVSDNAKIVGTVALHESNPQGNDAEAIGKVELEVRGGTAETTSPGELSALYSEDCADFVSGGTFNTEIPAKFVANDRALLVDEDGKAMVVTEADAEAKAGAAVEKDGKKVYYTTEKAAENNNPSTGDQTPEIEVFVVEVGGKKFSTMEEAIEAAKNGGTVTLLRDLDGDAFSGKKCINITEAGTNVTIDLADHKISLNNADTVSVLAPNVTLAVKNGTIVNTHKDSYGLYTYATNDNIDVTFENLTLRTVDQAIGVQGKNSNQNVTLKNCDIKCETTAVYWPPKSGTLTIDGTRIEAKSGVTVKGGSVVVESGTVITATGDKVVPDDYYDGNPDKKLVSTGSAIYVESGYNDRDIVLDIQGGTLESKNGVTVLYYAKEGEETEANRDIVISGGTFVGEPPANEFIVPGFGLNKNPDGSFGVHKHVLVEVAEVPATCDKDGAKAHWKCKDCGDLYLDEGMKTPVTDPNTLVIAKLGHKATHVPAKPATVEAEGVVEHWYCAVCNTYFADAKLTKTMTKAEIILAKLPKEFTVTFESGAGKPVAVVVKDGALLEEPAAPTLKGWKFLGWFKVKNADGTVAEKWDFAKDAVTADTTLYGGWVKDEPAKPAARPTNKLPKTGDASMLPMMAVGISGVAALAAASKRRKH